MSASRILLVISVLSVGVLAACAGPDTYPITGEPVDSLEGIGAAIADLPRAIFKEM